MKQTVIILVNYNSAHETELCLKSLLRSDTIPQVVIVDNTPNDNRLEKAIAIYPLVHIIRPSENLGFGRGNNIGIRWAISKGFSSLFILNNDARVLPDTISQLERSLEQYPNAGILAPRIVLEEDADVLWYGGGEIDWFRGSAKVPGVKGPADAPLAMTTRDVTFASGCAMFIRRDVFIKIGGFDPRFFMYEEDLELCLRASKNGYKIRYIPQSLVLHKMQGSQRDSGEKTCGILDPQNPRLAFYITHLVRNRLLNMKQHAEGIQLLCFFIGFPAFLGLKMYLYIKSGAFLGAGALFTGFKLFIKDRNIPYKNELQ